MDPRAHAVNAIPRSRDPAIPYLSVVVPTYNERESLSALLARLDRVAQSLALEVIIVDDASPDGTGRLGEELAQTFSMSVAVLHRPVRHGLASAAIDGAALARGHVLSVMDADLSHPPELLPILSAAVESRADIAVASRYVPGGGIADWSPLRRLLSRAATILARTVLRLRVRDPLSGFFAIRTAMLTDQAYLGVGYKLLLEILVRHRGDRVVEIPYRFVDRRHGRSKLAPAEIAEFVALLVHLMRPRANVGTLNGGR